MELVKDNLSKIWPGWHSIRNAGSLLQLERAIAYIELSVLCVTIKFPHEQIIRAKTSKFLSKYYTILGHIILCRRPSVPLERRHNRVKAFTVQENDPVSPQVVVGDLDS